MIVLQPQRFKASGSYLAACGETFGDLANIPEDRCSANFRTRSTYQMAEMSGMRGEGEGEEMSERANISGRGDPPSVQSHNATVFILARHSVLPHAQYKESWTSQEADLLRKQIEDFGVVVWGTFAPPHRRSPTSVIALISSRLLL